MFFASRFVAGKTAENAIAAARRVNERGLNAILDFLGEDVKEAEGSRKAADEYIHLLELISSESVRAAISVKMSQMGSLISRDLCHENLRRILAEASRLGLFVWFDMEGSALTQKTIEMFDLMRQD